MSETVSNFPTGWGVQLWMLEKQESKKARESNKARKQESKKARKQESKKERKKERKQESKKTRKKKRYEWSPLTQRY